MPDSGPSDREILRAALERGPDCLSVEDLERVLAEPADSRRPEWAQHLRSCAYCQTELHLLREFHAGNSSQDAAAVQHVTERLRARSKDIFGQASEPWWKAAFQARWLSPAALAMAGILVVAAIAVQMRHAAPPALDTTNRGGGEVLRSASVSITSPVGDLQEQPKEIRWDTVPAASKYRVRLLEVDRAEIWQAETTDNHISLPSNVEQRIVPLKTLLCEVTVFDASGSRVAASELVRFRLLQNFHSR